MDAPVSVNLSQSTYNYDIINLHWVEQGVVSLKKLTEIGKPIIWTLHDMSPFSGGFAYRGAEVDTGFYHITDEREKRSKALIEHKRKLFGEISNLTIVSPSKWLAEEARLSGTFGDHPVINIPYSLNQKIFSPKACHENSEFDLPQDKTLFLFGADGINQKRKGGHLVLHALKKLVEVRSKNDYTIVLFGADELDPCWKIDGLTVVNVGKITEEKKMAALYARVHFTFCPSLEDNLPNVVLESLACGTPVIGSNVGGIPDMVQDGENGYLFEIEETDSLLAKIQMVLDMSEEHYKEMSTTARSTSEEKYNEELQASRYLRIYEAALK